MTLCHKKRDSSFKNTAIFTNEVANAGDLFQKNTRREIDRGIEEIKLAIS